MNTRLQRRVETLELRMHPNERLMVNAEFVGVRFVEAARFWSMYSRRQHEPNA